MLITGDQFRQMIEVCLQPKFLHPPGSVVVKEPYVPYIPTEWSGVLVLGEAQNLSAKYQTDVNALGNLSPEDRVRRLKGSKLGVIPWDDGSLKLAVMAALGVEPEQVAVSNGILWSQRTEQGTNANPSDELVSLSSDLWSELLPILKPTHIVTASIKAETVVAACMHGRAWKGIHIPSRNPSPLYINQLVGLFREDDLLARYHEVRDVIKKHPEWVDKYRQKKVFYACHLVSICTPYRLRSSRDC